MAVTQLIVVMQEEKKRAVERSGGCEGITGLTRPGSQRKESLGDPGEEVGPEETHPDFGLDPEDHRKNLNGAGSRPDVLVSNHSGFLWKF